MSNKQCILIVKLDLSAMFVMINHEMLLEQLSVHYSARDQAFGKKTDVPQGSGLWPNFCEDYDAAPIGDILRKHSIQFSIYADYTPAYLPFNPNEVDISVIQLALKR